MNAYTILMMESDWPGDDNVPAFSWTKHPEKFIASLPSLFAAGIEPALLIGLEGFGGRHVDAQYIKDSANLARQAKAAGVKIMIVGIESEEFTNYTTEYRPLVKAVGPYAETLLTHFHGGVLAHPGDRVGDHWEHTPTVAQFYAENPEINGLMYQFDKASHAGRFLVPDTDLVAQLASARRRLPAHISLHAGEYANLVSQAKAQHAGDVCAALGYNTWNGVGKVPIPPVVDTFVAVPDAVDVSRIAFENLHGDCSKMIRAWPVTGTLTAAKVTGNRINFPNTASGRWTLANPGILGSCWEIACVDGHWKGRTFDDLESFKWDKDWTGGSSFHPDPGTALHFMLSGPARNVYDGEHARTNIVRVT